MPTARTSPETAALLDALQQLRGALSDLPDQLQALLVQHTGMQTELARLSQEVALQAAEIARLRTAIAHLPSELYGALSLDAEIGTRT